MTMFDPGGSARSLLEEVSLTDPQAAWVARKNTDPFFAYDANYLIDNKTRTSSTPRAHAPAGSLRSPLHRTMLDRVQGGASTFDHSGSQATRFMVQSGCSSGWSIGKINTAYPGVGQVDAF